MIKLTRIISLCKIMLTISFVFCLLIPTPGSANDGQKSNETRCKEYCAQHPDICSYCSSRSGCGGSGVRSIVTFNHVYHGKHWYVCAETRRARENRETCEDWCNKHREHPDHCIRCSASATCGKDQKSIMHFKGHSAANWYACAKTTFEHLSDENEKACNDWCAKNKPRCAKCSTLKYCGRGYERLKKTWGGAGKNWHACKKK